MTFFYRDCDMNCDIKKDKKNDKEMTMKMTEKKAGGYAPVPPSQLLGHHASPFGMKAGPKLALFSQRAPKPTVSCVAMCIVI